ncbi:unnamed protein product [Rotaria sp. Silwood2]|nr:unnamed protein product [Rotaria sp. Silwood2]CAF4612869.1 unnamed protein product [Rotaria sp. Silwood2]
MSTNCIFMLIVVLVSLLSVNGEQNKTKDEDMCGVITNILCVKDLLADIAKAAKDIRKTANEIEQKVFKKDLNKLHLITTIIGKRSALHSSFPTSKHHMHSLTMSNIDKDDFIRLIKEQHYAIGYLYNSIESLHYIQSTSGKKFDNLFNKTQKNLKKNILCNYIDILRVYSENWFTIDQINGIQITETREHELSLSEYNSYSIIIAELITKWMRCIENVINNLKYKLI